MRTRVFLTPADNTLVGKFAEEHEHIHVICDSTIGAYSVILPDLFSPVHKEFIFYNLHTTGAGNAVTLRPQSGQTMDFTIVSHVVNPGDSVTVVSDMRGTWLLSDVNRNILPLPLTFGDSANGVYIGSDGNLVLNGTARSWKDKIGDVINLKNTGVGVSTNSTENTVDFVTTSNLSDYIYSNVQLNHDRDLTYTSIHPHLHWFQDRNATPNFLFEYRYQVNGAAKTTAWTYLKCNTNAFTYTSGTIMQISYTSGITVPANTGLSDIVQFRIYRDNANTSGQFSGADGFAATVGIISFDVHYVINGFGSNEELIK